MAYRTNLLELSDQELLVKIKENQEALGVVFKKCKNNSIRFMQKMTSGSINQYELDDVFQDAIIVLYENILKDNFVLTCTFQTYLNSVCRFQLLNKLGKSRLNVDFDDNSDNDDDDDDESPMNFNSSITDSLDEIEDPKEEKYKAIERALELLKTAGGHCYELITLFWYHKKSMNELTDIFGYNNSDTTKSRKAKCQKRLEKIAYNELHRQK